MAQPKTYEHCLAVYVQMESQAVTIDDELIYTGFFSSLVQKELNLPTPYYTKIKNILEDLGCIEQRRRGGGRTRSEWILHYPPDPYLFDQVQVLDVGRRRRTSQDELDATITGLNTRLVEVERQLSQLQREVRDAHSRLGNSKQVS